MSITSVLISCKRADGPETVALKFANHFIASEYLEAAKYGTESTVHLMSLMDDWASVGFYLPQEETFTISEKDVDCTVNGDIAVCIYTLYDESQKLDLVRIEGRWLVDIPIDELDDEGWYEADDGNFDVNEINLN